MLFAHHLAVLDKLASHLEERQIPFIRIDGSTPSKDRHNLTQAFQTNVNIKVAILGITAAGIALTLTSANIVCFLELYWTPGSLIQAEDRVHRIGQLKNVKIFYFFGINTIDELLWPLVRKKMQLLGKNLSVGTPNFIFLFLGEFVEGTTDQDLNAAVLNTTEAAPGTNPSARSEGFSEASTSTSKVKTEEIEFIKSESVTFNKESITTSSSTGTSSNNVMDPVTKKIYNLENDDDLLGKLFSQLLLLV